MSSSDSSGPTNDAKQENSYLANGFRRKKKAKSGTVTTEYSAGLSTAMAKVGSDPISYIQGHHILGFERGGQFYWYLTDALGSVRDIVSGTDGAVLQSYDYRENGEKTVTLDGGITNWKTWVGGLSVNDDTADSGLYLMGHRHYDSSLGRFLSRDPIGFAGGLNLYEYAASSPVGMVDPEGLRSLAAIFAWNAVKSAAFGFVYGATVTAAFALGTVGGTVAGILLVTGGLAFAAYGAMQAIEKYGAGQWTNEDSAALSGSLLGGVAGGMAGSRASLRYMESSAQTTLQVPCQSPYSPGRALNAGMVADRNGFTKAGRALQKHGSRPGSVFPKAPNRAVEANKMGQAILSEIILSTNQLVKGSRSGNLHIFDRPTGRGASYAPDGSLAGFVERVPEP